MDQLINCGLSYVCNKEKKNQNVCEFSDLLLGVVEFVGPLHCWVKDGLWSPHLDLHQAHVDPEHSGLDQLVGAAMHPTLYELLEAGDARLQQAVGQQAGRQEVPEDSLDLLGSDDRVGVLHQALAALHVALLQARGQQVGHALQLPTQDGALEPQVRSSEET